MTVQVRHGVNHVPPGTPEFVGDSKHWIAHIARNGGGWADLNWLGKWDTHYLYPLHHGFVDPEGKIPANTPITKMTDREVNRLVAHWEGLTYRISPIEENVNYAVKRGVKVEVEEKRRQPITAINHLHDAIESRHDWVQIKVGMWLPGHPYNWLEPAHRRFKTIGLTHGMRGDDNPKKYATLPADVEEFMDFYRGWPPHWV